MRDIVWGRPVGFGVKFGQQHSILEAGSGRRLPNLTVPRPLYATPFEDARGQATVDGIFFHHLRSLKY